MTQHSSPDGAGQQHKPSTRADPPIPTMRYFLPSVAAGGPPRVGGRVAAAEAGKLPGSVSPPPRIRKLAHMETAARAATSRADLFSARTLPPLEAFDLPGF